MTTDMTRTTEGLHIFTDGSCLGNPGPGGWAYIITDQNKKVTATQVGSATHTTNNQMELTAAIEAMKALPADVPSVLYCDSEYVVKGVGDRRASWEANGWKTTQGKPIANLELWHELYALHDKRPLASFQWVRGHAGTSLNETVDRLARAEAEKAGLGEAQPVTDSTPPDTQADVPVLMNIPLPPSTRRPAHPWNELQPGNCFFAAGAKLASMQVQCSRKNGKTGRTFTSRAYQLEGVKGVMVWRTA